MFGTFVSDTDKMPRDVIQIFTNSFIVTVRPSGTEPKLKYYCQLLPHGEPSGAKGTKLLQEVRERADSVAKSIYKGLLERIDLTLGEAALRLPDIIDLEHKQQFDQHTVQQLYDVLGNKTYSSLDGLLDWLRAEVAAMTPGTDPLPALKAPVAFLCDQWERQPAAGLLLSELKQWANS